MLQEALEGPPERYYDNLRPVIVRHSFVYLMTFPVLKGGLMLGDDRNQSRVIFLSAHFTVEETELRMLHNARYTARAVRGKIWKIPASRDTT